MIEKWNAIPNPNHNPNPNPLAQFYECSVLSKTPLFSMCAVNAWPTSNAIPLSCQSASPRARSAV